MSPSKKIFYQFSSLFPVSFLQAVSPIQTLFPYHHVVSDQRLEHIHHLYRYKNTQQFEHDLDVLLKNNRAASFDEILAAIQNGRRLPRKAFLLTFDDGFRQVSEVVAPILKRKGIPAVFFINPAFIDNKILFYRNKISLLLGQMHQQKLSESQLAEWAGILQVQNQPPARLQKLLKGINQDTAVLVEELAAVIGYSFDEYLQSQQPYLSTTQVNALHADGFTIGAHSMSHPYYQLLSLDEQVTQTVDSFNFVNNMTGTLQSPFSFPHSDVGLSQALFEALKAKNIPVLFGIQNQQEELHNRMLHRFNAERPELPMERQIKGLHFMLWMKRLAGTQKVNR